MNGIDVDLEITMIAGLVVIRNPNHDQNRIYFVSAVQIQTSQIMGSIQLGIQHAVGSLASKPERDLLMQDFMTVETTNFPSEGSNHTPAHHFSEFKFKNYAPIAFRYFRDLFGIEPQDFLVRRGKSVFIKVAL